MTYVRTSAHATSDYLHASAICIVMRSAEWHRDGDLIGLAWSCNCFTAASALCRHGVTTPVWLFVFGRYKHTGSDLSLSHRCEGVTHSAAESLSKLFLLQRLTRCHHRPLGLIVKVQRDAFLHINIYTNKLTEIFPRSLIWNTRLQLQFLLFQGKNNSYMSYIPHV